ncbi:hypothetical protein ABIC89_002642 [Variovorax boronicumulans]
MTHDGTSVVGLEAVRRFARIYGVEAQLKELSDDERRTQRQQLARPLPLIPHGHGVTGSGERC